MARKAGWTALSADQNRLKGSDIGTNEHTENTVAHRVATAGILTALALVLSYLESIVPLTAWIPIPGVRLGLANIAVLICVLRCGFFDGCAVNFLRIFAMFLLFGNVTGFLFSLCGAILSMLFLLIAKKAYGTWFSAIGLSTGCAVFHNLGQLIAAAFLFSPLTALGYAGWMILIGILSGTVNGMLVALTLRGIHRHSRTAI